MAVQSVPVRPDDGEGRPESPEFPGLVPGLNGESPLPGRENISEQMFTSKFRRYAAISDDWTKKDPALRRSADQGAGFGFALWNGQRHRYAL